MSSSTVQLSSPGGATATIFPEEGFNCIDLQLLVGGERVKIIHAESDVLNGGSPTRSGMPVLFPFPNRIADAEFTWRGRQYEVPVTHPGDRHAIHGFACRTAWTDFETSSDGSAVTGRFRLSRDAPGGDTNWPGDLELRLTYSLLDSSLTVTSTVSNVDDHDVPFGLGFHAYLAPLAAGSGPDAVAACRAYCDANSYWILEDSIPTGETLPVSAARDLRSDPVLGDRVLDDVLTDLPPFVAGEDGLMTRAALTGGDAKLLIECDESWRDMVVFTPPNRESFAIEPYTCPTDAVNLDARGFRIGWQVLGPGEVWSGEVKMRAVAA
jgi:aldose 1-epimerase